MLDRETLETELPLKMREAQRWILWKLVPNEPDKPKKVPFYANGTPRKGKLDAPEDVANLATFDTAITALEANPTRWAGLGFALGKDGSGHWQGADLDHLSEHLELTPFIELAPGYIEHSPSGDGVHCIGYGKPFTSLASNATGIEAYSSGRFFTVTGDAIGGGIADISAFVEILEPLHRLPDAPRATTETGDGRISGKGRNQALASLAGTMRHRGMSEAAILAALVAENAARYKPPLPDREVEQIAKSYGRYPPGDNRPPSDHDRSEPHQDFDDEDELSQQAGNVLPFRARRPKPQSDNSAFGTDESDDDLALQFIDRNPLLRHVHKWGHWMVWNETHWGEDGTLAVFDKARGFLREISSAGGDEKRRRRLLSAQTVAAVERLARCDSRAAATPDQWDEDDLLLNTPTGQIDLSTGRLKPNNHESFCTRITSSGPHGDCPRWLQFINEVTDGDEGLIDFLQRITGYASTGLTHEHSLFFFYGTGGNGKGVFLNTIVKILKDYAAVAPMEVFTESSVDRHPTELAMLRGVRLVVSQETEEGRKWAESRIKALTGGDPITARFMRADFFTFEPKFKLLIAGNHKPKLHNVDEAMRRRLHLIPFTVTIPSELRDPNLAATLEAEHPGIMRWIIEGYAAYRRIGLAPPTIVQNATSAYFGSEDMFTQWIDDHCDIGANYWEPAGRLFESWKKYADAENIKAGDSRTFASRMESAGFSFGNTKGRGGRHRAGIRLKLVETDPDPRWPG